MLFAKLGIGNSLICINHRELVESFIKKTYPGFENDRDWTVIGDSFRMMDKAAKKPRKELLAEYSKLPVQYAESLLDFAAAHGTPEQVESAADVKNLEKWDHLKNLWDSLENRQVSSKEINLGIVRGLDYYSGVVFEVFDHDIGNDALAGGGRYENDRDWTVIGDSFRMMTASQRRLAEKILEPLEWQGAWSAQFQQWMRATLSGKTTRGTSL